MGEKSSTCQRTGAAASWRLRNERTGAVVADRVRVARSVLERWQGLLLSPRLQPGEALWLDPCNGIHTIGLGYAISTVTLGADGTILGFRCPVPPFRIVWPVPGGRITVEMLPATFQRADLNAGDRLVLEGV